MSTITGLGSGLSGAYAALNQQLFKSIDQNSDGSVNQTELEQAVTANGASSQDADQLYAALDPQSTGSVDAQQFVTGLQSLLSSQTQGALIQAQSGTSGTQATSPHTHRGHHHGGQMQQLFDSIDSNDDGEIDQSELEQAVSAAGGTTDQADQLFAQLDPNDTGSIDKQQFTSGLDSLLGAAGGPPPAPLAGQSGDTIDISIQITETSAAAPTATSDASASPDAGQATSGSGGAPAAAGGGGSSASATTEITYNADGTVTTTVTNPDGTQTVTTSGTPKDTSTAANGTGNGASTNPAGSASLDRLFSDFLNVSRKLAGGALSSGTLGQLLTQQQAG